MFVIKTLFALTSTAFATPAFVADISATRDFYAPNQPVRIRLTVANSGEQEQGILRYIFPSVAAGPGGLSVAEMDFNVLEVTRNGEPVPYIGKHVLLADPIPEDFFRMAPGQSMTRSLDLDGAYDLSQDGEYEVRFRTGGAAFEGSGGRHVVGDEVSSNVVSFTVAGRTNGGGRNRRAKPTQREGCSIDQEAILETARTAAQGMTDNSVTYLESFTGAGDHPRFEEWFGTESQSRFNTALSNFQAISTSMPLLTFQCTCKQRYYAYVYPNEEYVVYPCKVFWQVDVTGTDSQGGTLVHEASHFNVVAGTDDYQYGQAGCRDLADSSESYAIQNADSHEYFAENDPFLG